jgi:hypothetical protein
MRNPIVATLLSVFVLVSVVGCQRGRGVDGVSDSVFVDVMAKLKRVRDMPGLDSGRRAFKRDSILQGKGLKPAQLEAAALRLAHNPARAQTMWQAIDRRAADTTKAKK